VDPTTLGPYTIKSRLGRGGMGSVYEAEDSLSGRTVAVKTLITQVDENTSLRRRFQAEIEALKALRHPGIVQLLAYGEEGGQPYFAMELVRGRSLEQMLRDGRRFSWRETISVALAIVKALKYAHDNGVIHRDLKPANLLLAPADDPPGTRSVTVKLADFGIARLFGDTNQTMAGTIVGTAEYMSPEQARGDHVDQRTDIYALGLVMFAMLAGKPPFHGGRAMQLIERQKHEPPPRVASLAADVPPALDELIDRMLAKDPARRPPNALALSKLLTHVVTLATTDTARHDPPAAHPHGERPAGGTTPLHTRPPQTVAPAIEPTRPQQARAASPPPAALPPQPVGRHETSTPSADLFGETQDMPGRKAATRGPAILTAAGRPAASAIDPTGPLPAVGSPPTARSRAGAPLPTVPEHENGWNGPYRETRHVEVEDLDRRERQQEASRRLWQAIAAAVAFAAISTVIGVGSWLIFRTPTADELMTRIETGIDGGTSRVDALKSSLPKLEQFLTLYADDPRAEQVRGFVREVEIDRLARRARLRERKADPPYFRVEREYRQAMAVQPTEPIDCLDALRAILKMPRDDLSEPLSAAPDDDLVHDFELWLDLVRAKIRETLPLVRAEDRARRQDAARLEGAETPAP
jgi:serine/threonine protein kinase